MHDLDRRRPTIVAKRRHGGLLLQATGSTPPESVYPKRRWTVDWEAVHDADRWRDQAYVPSDTQVLLGERRIGDLTVAGTVPRGPRESTLPDPAPLGAQRIFAVFARRCAGYAREPSAVDVVEGLRAERPTETQRWAIDVFVREADQDDIHEAWLNAEFDLADLMRHVDRTLDHTWHDDFGIATGLTPWIKIDYE